jgi:hypothetical protein
MFINRKAGLRLEFVRWKEDAIQISDGEVVG